MKALIVDDEPIARDIIDTYVSKLEGWQVAGRCGNALEAFSFLSRNEVDVLFLDINMPEVSGIDLLRTLKNPPQVIFTTAYSEFALESYDLDAIDYLLKPVSFERFLKAIQKVTPRQMKQTAHAPDLAGQAKHLFVKAEGRLVRIDLQKVKLIEGLKDYIRFCTTEGSITVHSTMKNVEEQLAAHAEFLRVHKSFIININFVSEVWGNMIKVQDVSITVGSTYREAVSQVFERMKLL